ncbi:Signal transduction histidine kinase [Chryseobacterium sp. RU37D]|uniref:sensor histidine kinase n=1 Tax=Chryseobacterium sp. RU37D TaxID=1907397 RepID=UPI000953AE3A|nr:HAMP domain-containing sensor histidine kinase [Chryseobacterium sp. RU37D]SIQ95543.1 Signal transduction histidine kinase [Chryseobacterium sp. RU37D]
MKTINILLTLICFLYKGQQQTNYYEKWYTTEDNMLPQNTIKSIVQDKYDFIWLSTENGIVRFDGKDFKIYDSDIPNVENRTMLIDGAAEDDWLFTFFQSGEIPSIISKRSFSIEPNNLKVKKFGTENLYKILKNNSESVKQQRFYYFITKNEYYILEGYNLYYHNSIKTQYIRKLKDYFYYNFFLSGNQLFYFKDPSSIEQICRTGQIKKYTTGITKASDYAIFVNNANQQTLIRNNNKIYLLEYVNNNIVLSVLYDDKKLKQIVISCLYYDRKNNMLLLGTKSNGLLMVRKNFITAVASPSLGNNIFYALAEYDKNHLITARGEVFNKNGYCKKLSFNEEIDPYGIITLRPHSEFLIKRENKIILYNNNKISTLLDFKVSSSSIYSISKGKNGKIWISFWEKGKYKFGYIIIQNQKIIQKEFYYTKYSVRNSFQINEDEILLATEKGLFLFNQKKRIIKTLIDKINFRSINSNGDKLIWVETYGKGLYLYKDGKVYFPPKYLSQSFLFAHCVLEDNYGYYWISSNNGLFQVKKKDLVDCFLGRKEKIYIHKYNKNDGLSTTEFNGGANTNGIKQGDYIIFPSMNGLIYINTKASKPILSNEIYYMDRFIINGKEIPINNRTINIDRKFGYMKVFIDYPDYGNLDNNYIEYRIDDNQWELLADNKTLNINSLSKGKHLISFRKLKNFSSAYIYKSLSLHVKPAFWETVLFKMSACAIFLLILYMLYKLRLRKIEKEKRILNQKIEEHTSELKKTITSLSITREELYAQLYRRKKFIASISHDIKSPIKFIKLSAGYLMENTNDTEQKKALNSIYESSDRIIDFIDSTIKYNKIFVYDNYKAKENVKLYNFIKQRISLFKNAAEFKALRIVNKIGKRKIIKTNPDVLSIIVHNILDNAIKYTDQNGSILIYDLKEDNQYKLVIEDTGIGMSPKEIKKLNEPISSEESNLGYRFIKELIPLIDCTIVIESTKNVGTKIFIIFNVN